METDFIYLFDLCFVFFQNFHLEATYDDFNYYSCVLSVTMLLALVVIVPHHRSLLFDFFLHGIT